MGYFKPLIETESDYSLFKIPILLDKQKPVPIAVYAALLLKAGLMEEALQSGSIQYESRMTPEGKLIQHGMKSKLLAIKKIKYMKKLNMTIKDLGAIHIQDL